ncbi:MAG TPA: MBL fold metallo-hydrolase [Candidatus Hungatella pullicola]|nr:MBL fold metallo-hydrolase [Candidatus Hungatella pullicola]
MKDFRLKHIFSLKTLAFFALTLNILLSSVLGMGTADLKEGELSAKKMGFSGNLPIGPGSRIFGGGSLTMLADEGNRQMLSLVFQAKDGTLVVVDGGWDSDSVHLLEVIKQKGGHVSGWFITHPHSDHAGALVEILNNPDSGITIDGIYYSLAEQSWYDSHGAGREEFVNTFRQALDKVPAENLHGDIQKGQEIQLGEIKIMVLNNPYLLEETSVNNSSVVYKIYMNGVSTMVLGDLGPEGGQKLLGEYTQDVLQSDIVQMSHHGQYGVNKDVYAAINAQVALWPCPLWLWNNDNGGGIGSGDWKTLETRQWMEELGIRANYCIKDGDQIIY